MRAPFYIRGFLAFVRLRGLAHSPATKAEQSWDSIPAGHTPESRLEPCQGWLFVDCDVSPAGSKARQGHSLRYFVHYIDFALTGTFKVKIIAGESESHTERERGREGGKKGRRKGQRERESFFFFENGTQGGRRFYYCSWLQLQTSCQYTEYCCHIMSLKQFQPRIYSWL